MEAIFEKVMSTCEVESGKQVLIIFQYKYLYAIVWLKQKSEVGGTLRNDGSKASQNIVEFINLLDGLDIKCKNHVQHRYFSLNEIFLSRVDGRSNINMDIGVLMEKIQKEKNYSKSVYLKYQIARCFFQNFLGVESGCLRTIIAVRSFSQSSNDYFYKNFVTRKGHFGEIIKNVLHISNSFKTVRSYINQISNNFYDSVLNKGLPEPVANFCVMAEISLFKCFSKQNLCVNLALDTEKEIIKSNNNTGKDSLLILYIYRESFINLNFLTSLIVSLSLLLKKNELIDLSSNFSDSLKKKLFFKNILDNLWKERIKSKFFKTDDENDENIGLKFIEEFDLMKKAYFERCFSNNKQEMNEVFDEWYRVKNIELLIQNMNYLGGDINKKKELKKRLNIILAKKNRKEIRTKEFNIGYYYKKNEEHCFENEISIQDKRTTSQDAESKIWKMNSEFFNFSVGVSVDIILRTYNIVKNYTINESIIFSVLEYLTKPKDRCLIKILPDTGNSYIVTILASIFGLLNHEIDVVISSKLLTERDFNVHAKIYESLILDVESLYEPNIPSYIKELNAKFIELESKSKNKNLTLILTLSKCESKIQNELIENYTNLIKKINQARDFEFHKQILNMHLNLLNEDITNLEDQINTINAIEEEKESIKGGLHGIIKFYESDKSLISTGNWMGKHMSFNKTEAFTKLLEMSKYSIEPDESQFLVYIHRAFAPDRMQNVLLFKEKKQKEYNPKNELNKLNKEGNYLGKVNHMKLETKKIEKESEFTKIKTDFKNELKNFRIQEEKFELNLFSYLLVPLIINLLQFRANSIIFFFSSVTFSQMMVFTIIVFYFGICGMKFNWKNYGLQKLSSYIIGIYSDIKFMIAHKILMVLIHRHFNKVNRYEQIYLKIGVKTNENEDTKKKQTITLRKLKVFQNNDLETFVNNFIKELNFSIEDSELLIKSFKNMAERLSLLPENEIIFKSFKNQKYLEFLENYLSNYEFNIESSTGNHFEILLYNVSHIIDRIQNQFNQWDNSTIYIIVEENYSSFSFESFGYVKGNHNHKYTMKDSHGSSENTCFFHHVLINNLFKNLKRKIEPENKLEFNSLKFVLISYQDGIIILWSVNLKLKISFDKRKKMLLRKRLVYWN